MKLTTFSAQSPWSEVAMNLMFLLCLLGFVVVMINALPRNRK